MFRRFIRFLRSLGTEDFADAYHAARDEAQR